MKKFIFLFIISVSFVASVSVESFSQSIAGSYESIDGQSRLEIEEVPDSKNLKATIKGVKIPQGGTTNKIKLKGKSKLIQQDGEEFYLLTLQGMGKWKDNDGNKYPIALTLSAFITKISPIGMTSQFAAAYEFKGLAEGVTGDVIGWRKL